MNDDTDELIEVEIKKSIDLINFALRLLVTERNSSAIVAEWFGNKAGLTTFIVVLILVTLWPWITTIQSRLSPGWKMLVIQVIPLVGIVSAFVYTLPNETLQIIMKIAWAVFRTKT